MIDTGCDVNLCRESFWSKLGGIESELSRMRLNGPANVCFHTKFRFNFELAVDGGTYDVSIYTVPDDTVGYDIILGRPLFQTSVELRVSPLSVTIAHVDTVRQMMNIDVNVNELAVGE